MRKWWKSIVGGACVIAALVAAGGAALYYLSLPSNPGPENSSPPPEGIGLIVGASLGCVVGCALLTVARRSAWRALGSFGAAYGLGAAAWLAFGAGSLSDRLGDCLLAAYFLGFAAALGVGAGALISRVLRDPTRTPNGAKSA